MSRETVLAIDPGPEQSAVVEYDGERVLPWGIIENFAIPNDLRHLHDSDVLAIEMIASYGMPVGASVFNTCVWIGRFVEAWQGDTDLIYRKDVKLHLCQTPRAKDANIRQALIDRFPATGGGKVPQIGTKAKPGPLYGMRSHLWAALAVAVYWWDTNCEQLTTEQTA